MDADATRQNPSQRPRENVLLDLAKRQYHDTVEAFQSITEATAVALAVERVSIWRLLPGDEGIACEDLYTLSSRRHDQGLVLWARDYPRYFNELLESRTIPADDARTDPRTAEFATSYLAPRGITSMMDVPIWHNGALYGILCHEHVGKPRHWRVSETELAGNLADLVSLALERGERRRVQQRWESVMEQIAEAVFVIGPDHTIIQMNARGHELLERVGGSTRPAERLGLLEYRDRAGKRVPDGQLPIERALRGNQATDILTIWRKPEGFLGSFCVMATPIKQEGRVTSVVAVLQDVTEEVRQDQLKAEFLSTLAHELKTPATIVKGFTQLLLDDTQLPESVQDRIAAIDEASLRTERLIEDAVEMAGLTVGRLALSLEVVELRSLIESSIASITTTSPAHPVRLTAAPSIEVMADRARIEQVIRRLLENAIRYSPEQREVDVAIHSEPGRAVVAVREHGRGIPASRLGTIFDPFTYGDGDVGSRGLGIGLYLAREIVRLHGGDMWCESVEGVGSTFAFWLPRGGGP